MADIRNDELDAIFGRAVLTVEALSADVRERIARIAADVDATQIGATLLEIRVILEEEFSPLLRAGLSDAMIAAAILGAQDIADALPAEALATLRTIAPPMPPGRILPPVGLLPGGEPLVRFPVIDRAAEGLVRRNILTRPAFDAASLRARSRAFTVAGETTEDAIATIRDVMVEMIERGETLAKFRKTVAEQLEGSFLGPAHAETVFRTNIQTAFNAAHDELADRPIVSELFPYQAYLPINDGRVRDEHLALGRRVPEIPGSAFGIQGTNIYRRADPFWDFFTPPWHFNCRCGVNLLTIEAAARAGLNEARQWLETGIIPPLVSRLPDIPFRPDPNFVGGRAARLAA